MDIFNQAENDMPEMDIEEDTMMEMEELSIDPEIQTELSQVFGEPGAPSAYHEAPAGEEPLPISDVHSTSEGNAKVSEIEGMDTSSPEIGSEINTYDTVPVQGAVNGLLGDFGIEPEPMPVDPMTAMVQQQQGQMTEEDMAGVYPIRPELMSLAVEVLGESYRSLNESGIIMAHQERLAYASAVMKENTALPSTRKAKFLNAFMKNGKIIPELLPPDWYMSRGAMLKQNKQEQLAAARNPLPDPEMEERPRQG